MAPAYTGHPIDRPTSMLLQQTDTKTSRPQVIPQGSAAKDNNLRIGHNDRLAQEVLVVR